MRARGGFVRRSPPLALPLASVTLPDRSAREEPPPQLYLRCRRPFAGPSPRSPGPSSSSPLSSASSTSSRFPAALRAAPPRPFSGSSFPRLFPFDSPPPPFLPRASPLLPAAPPLRVGLLGPRLSSCRSSGPLRVAWSAPGSSASSARPGQTRRGSARSVRSHSARRSRPAPAALGRARAARSPQAPSRRASSGGGGCCSGPVVRAASALRRIGAVFSSPL